MRAVQGGVRSLREAIAGSGLTTTQIVARVGCTRKSLSNWRNGRRPSDYYIGRLSEVLGTDLWPLFDEPATRRHVQVRPSGQRYELLTVGGITVNWCVIALDHYAAQQIRCSYNRTPASLPPDIEQLRAAFVEDWEQRNQRGETHLPFNSQMYKLLEFDAGFRQMVDGEEVPILRLRFGPTDYFTQIVTDLNTVNPARNRYADAASLTEKPVPEFASILGVNLSLVTADGYLIVSERSKHAYLAGGRLHTSVAENILRPVDAGIEGAPDPFRAAARGAHEELGIQLDTRSLEFGAFGVEPTLCQYSLFAANRIAQTRDDILKLRSVGAPKDKWESTALLFVPFTPNDVAAFVAQTKERWLPIGLAAVILGLWQIGNSLLEIEAAFSTTGAVKRSQ
jgi:hypothetical protein